MYKKQSVCKDYFPSSETGYIHNYHPECDFTNPLYFLPGNDNVTVQLTLYNFMGRYSSSYNLLFADVLIITIPMLILFLFFNKKIVDGMVAGAVKG